jgi:hypothetical protein
MSTFILWYLLGSVFTFMFSAGAHFAYFQRSFPNIAKEQVRNDIANALFFATCISCVSWIGLVVTFGLSLCLKHGWKFPTTKGAI